MNTKHLIAAAAIALVGSAAFAQTEVELQRFGTDQHSTVTRAEVRAEFLRARAAGEVPALAEVENVAVAPKAVRAVDSTRAQVRAEVLKAQADGTLTTPAEVNVFATNAAGPVRSREEVAAEARAYTRAGQVARVQAGH